MGRPINKKYLGSEVGKIRATHYRLSGEAEEANGYIVAQKGTNKFIVSNNADDATEPLRLVNKAAGTLAEGEFRITGLLDNSTVVNVTKLRNRTIQYSDSTNSTHTVSEINVSDDGKVQIDSR